MPTKTSYSTFLASTVSCLFILLFTYAATSKLLDYENFEIQLGQSPLLSPFANALAITVPLVEIVISVALLTAKWKYYGLYASFTLMVMFTAYIFIILNYSSFVPCSCGGILEKMSWEQHIVFNIAFVLLGAAAILAFPLKHQKI